MTPSIDTVRAAVIIARPVKSVFDYLRDIEARLRLNPSYELTAFEWGTPPLCAGSRYHVHAIVGATDLDYQCEVIEFEEQSRLVTRQVGAQMAVRLTLEPVPGGTQLTHEEEFLIPDAALQPEVGSPRALLGNLLAAVFGQRDVALLQAERASRHRVTVQLLEQRLTQWLERVRADVERRYPEGRSG